MKPHCGLNKNLICFFSYWYFANTCSTVISFVCNIFSTFSHGNTFNNNQKLQSFHRFDGSFGSWYFSRTFHNHIIRMCLELYLYFNYSFLSPTNDTNQTVHSIMWCYDFWKCQNTTNNVSKSGISTPVDTALLVSFFYHPQPLVASKITDLKVTPHVIGQKLLWDTLGNNKTRLYGTYD